MLVGEVGKDDSAIVEQVVQVMTHAYTGNTGKRRVLVLKAEGVKMDLADLKRRVDERVKGTIADVDTRVTVLGNVVRGGSPTAFDRLLGARFANVEVHELFAGATDFMVGWTGPGVTSPASSHDPYVVVAPL